MASDILVYRADTVPVGEDQLPHLELSREIARRFNFLYAPVFPEPKALEVPTLVGTDGRKMSKSYGNTIQIASTEEEVRKSVQSMVTDPARIRKSDPGHPEVCTVYSYYKALAPQLAEVRDTECRNAGIGCVACKKQLADVVVEYLSPMWERRNAVEKDPGMVDALLEAGTSQARQVASATMEQVREAMKI
ncbi:MAG: Tryptophan--tRNA ligase [Firmicutes bacterium ADurb.Bin506]|nr:MAG: Tryptophan--tRNA ligase [Firmicutes bacterium ADurb.Bin506]